MARSAGVSKGLLGVARAFLGGVTEVTIRGGRGAYRFPFSATNLSISLPHAGGNFYERQALDRLRTLLSPGDVVIDVGANIGNHSIVSSDLAEGDEGVPSLSLDSLKLERCDLLKVDVDGGEMAVLEGAAQTLERLRPTLAIEVLNTNMARVLPWLEARGYVVLREDTTGQAYSDFVMVHRTSRFRSV